MYQLVRVPRSSQRPKRIQKPRYICYRHEDSCQAEVVGQSFDINIAPCIKILPMNSVAGLWLQVSLSQVSLKAYFGLAN